MSDRRVLEWRDMYERATREIDQLVELGNAMRDGIDRLAHYIASNGESDVYTSMLEALMLSAVRWDNHHREVTL